MQLLLLPRVEGQISLDTLAKQIALVSTLRTLYQTPPGLCSHPGLLFLGNFHKRGEGHTKPVITCYVSHRIQGRQTDVQIVKSQGAELPEVFLIDLDTNSIQANPEIQTD